MIIVLRVAHKSKQHQHNGTGSGSLQSAALTGAFNLSQDGTVTEAQEMKTSTFPFSFIKSGFHQTDKIAGFIINQVIRHRRYITCLVCVSIILSCPFSLFAVN